MYTFEVFQDSRQQERWRWRCIAYGAVVVFDSLDSFDTAEDTEAAIKAVQQAIGAATITRA